MNYKFSDVINNKLLVAEVLTMLICAIGVILTVPITAYFVYRNAGKKSVDSIDK
ncbi:hypothetical protein FC72_GL001417 [Companilactobacillus tucceti DSM 20183]|uniref:Uncharacterized protein n=1 Tax=Companilactobacillus tucceti DSM 20183 TaxID=1423811 RepID=A0A0R1J8W9_9LACO|nr:YibE/F family protein [Companilactobacillus tucceti]KRK65347.1 hypothetical protein FC72_GL001417 [Companilactobacillus tucceti DSM 20183]